VQFDLLFGPAYKGIPLATAIGVEFARRGRDLPLAFNRKEAKDHGEGGTLIGAPLDGHRVLIVDDVITAGTAIGEALGLIAAAGGRRPGSWWHWTARKCWAKAASASRRPSAFPSRPACR